MIEPKLKCLIAPWFKPNYVCPTERIDYIKFCRKTQIMRDLAMEDWNKFWDEKIETLDVGFRLVKSEGIQWCGIFTNIPMCCFSAKIMSAIDLLLQSEEEFFFKAFLDFIKKRCVTWTLVERWNVILMLTLNIYRYKKIVEELSTK